MHCINSDDHTNNYNVMLGVYDAPKADTKATKTTFHLFIHYLGRNVDCFENRFWL